MLESVGLFCMSPEPDEEQTLLTEAYSAELTGRSDSIVASSPITIADSRRKQKKARKAAKDAIERASHEERQKRGKDVCQHVLSILKENDIPFGELLEFVSDPSNQRGNDRHRGLLSDPGRVLRVLDFWMSSSNSATGRNAIQEWAMGLVSHLVEREARTATDDGFLRTQKRPINEDFALEFSIEGIHAEFAELCPSMLMLLDSFSCTAKQRRMKTEGWQARRLNVSTVTSIKT